MWILVPKGMYHDLTISGSMDHTHIVLEEFVLFLVMPFTDDEMLSHFCGSVLRVPECTWSLSIYVPSLDRVLPSDRT